MRFHKSHQIHKAAAEGRNEGAMGCVLYEPSCAALLGAPALVATDRRILAVVPADPEVDQPEDRGLIVREAIQEARAVKGKVAQVLVRGTEARVAVEGVTHDHRANPDWLNLYPAYGHLFTGLSAPRLSLKLDLRLLVRLARALGTDNVELQLSDWEPELSPTSSGELSTVKGALRVLPLLGGGGMGLLMPLTALELAGGKEDIEP